MIRKIIAALALCAASAYVPISSAQTPGVDLDRIAKQVIAQERAW